MGVGRVSLFFETDPHSQTPAPRSQFCVAPRVHRCKVSGSHRVQARGSYLRHLLQLEVLSSQGQLGCVSFAAGASEYEKGHSQTVSLDLRIRLKEWHSFEKTMEKEFESCLVELATDGDLSSCTEQLFDLVTI